MGSLHHIVEDCLGIVQVFNDGSISRTHDITFPMKVQDDGSAVWRDCLYDKRNAIHLRLYKPRRTIAGNLIPIIYFFHGGGFCVGSRTWPNCHTCCLRLASALGALVVAPDYRLAPEHRLPAALDDAISAVKWLQIQALLGGDADEWLSDDVVDFDRVFILGDSSGGNLAHHLAIRFGRGSPDLNPVRVRGYVLMAPFFGGTVRTKSEAEGPPEEFLNMEILDRFWRLCVPVGDTADHPLANPFGPWSRSLASMDLDPMLVLVGGNEVMKDRVEDYYKKLEGLGKKIEYVEYQGEQHGFFVNGPFSRVADEVLQKIRHFMDKNSSP